MRHAAHPLLSSPALRATARTAGMAHVVATGSSNVGARTASPAHAPTALTVGAWSINNASEETVMAPGSPR